MASKILVIGSIKGALSSFFAKVAAINKKNGPFDACLCVGDLFGEGEEGVQDLLDGRISAPLPVYFTFGGSKLPDAVIEKVEANNGELAENIFFLGKYGITKLSSGLRIAVFGGDYDLEAYTQAIGSEKNPLAQPNFSASDVSTFKTTLSNAEQPVDILVTYAWPTQIAHHSNKPVDPSIGAAASPAISEILAAARPRYHFAAGKPVFWEREAFVWQDGTAATRFISLAPFNNPEKQRWFYAFNLETLKGDERDIPANATECPITALHATARANSKKRPLSDVTEQPADYRFGGSTNTGPGDGRKDRNKRKKRKGPPAEYTCRLCNQTGHWIQDCDMAAQSNGQSRGPKEINPDQCWFCLSNPKLSKHLIVSIGSELYLALPKGQLPFVEGGTAVPGGGHVLLVTVAHFSTLRSLPVEQGQIVKDELASYMAALTKCYAEYQCQPISFEVGRRGMHAHTQVCPIPNAMVGNAEKIIRDTAESESLLLQDDADSVLDAEHQTENYFRVDLPNGKSLVHLLQPNQHFNLQFGRLALANILGMPERADWKQCARSDEEEKQECQTFIKVFGQFDPAA